jgi:queuine tRNA-ribosyltransferase
MSEAIFKVLAKDTTSQARLGELNTNHGKVITPVFMPVGTKAAIRTMTPEELKLVGGEIILGNAYHLHLRPGEEVIAEAGGLHRFMNWQKAIITDSGGYQVFSLANQVEVDYKGVNFRSPIDGSNHFFSPQGVIDIQRKLGADIYLPLDYCCSYPIEKNIAKKSVNLTTRWARESKAVADGACLFGIIQGSTYSDLRRQSVEELGEIDFPGYAIGGLSVGEPHALMYDTLSRVTEQIPAEKPRYLMGVGLPESILISIGLGIDMFDSALPTRVARNGLAFTWSGRVNIRNSCFKDDFSPLDSDCHCYVCRNYSRSYLRHLFISKEILALRLLTWHNLAFIFKLVQDSRQAISEARFTNYQSQALAKLVSES